MDSYYPFGVFKLFMHVATHGYGKTRSKQRMTMARQGQNNTYCNVKIINVETSMLIMNRQFKHWRSTIPPISIKRNNYLSSRITVHKKQQQQQTNTANIPIEIQVLERESQSQKCGGVKSINGIPASLIIISSRNTEINKIYKNVEKRF